MPRPKATDPKVQRNIFPATSLWERAVTQAARLGYSSPTIYAAEALRKQVERDEDEAARDA